jgi:purine-binding chemotaxis protein CheW
VALIVDSIQEIAERSENEIKSPKNLMLDVEHIDGLFELDEGMVLIHDLDKFLTDDQVKLIMDAMKKTKNGADRTKGRVKKST